MLSAAEKHYIVEGADQNVRTDGRGCLDFRAVELELGLLAQASGSARLHLGTTVVLVGVKLEVGHPSADAHDAGKLSASVEFSACASPEFKGRSGEDRGAELASALELSLLGGARFGKAGIDLRSLCIMPGKICWVAFVDALVLNDGGNVLDALSLAARAALSSTRIPHLEITTTEEGGEPELDVDDDPSKSKPLNAADAPVIVTVSRLGKQCVVDLTTEEELCASAALSIAVNRKGHICGVTQDGSRGVDLPTLQQMTEVAQSLGLKLLLEFEKLGNGISTL